MIVVGLVWGVLASCGGAETAIEPENETAPTTTAAPTTTIAAPETALTGRAETAIEPENETAPTTTAAPTTTIAARSEWCLERDAGGWTQREPEPYDPSPLEAWMADTQRLLDQELAQQIQQANTVYSNMIERNANRPDIQANIEETRLRAMRMIRANHNDAVTQLYSRYARLHREAKADHDALQIELTELAELELRNELQRYELECQ